MAKKLSGFFKLDGGNVKTLASRLGVSPSTVRRWKKQGIPDKAVGKVKGVIADAWKGELGPQQVFTGRSKRAILYRARNRLVTNLHGRARNDWTLLNFMHRQQDERWLEFLQLGESLGYSEQSIKDAWYSPEI